MISMKQKINFLFFITLLFQNFVLLSCSKKNSSPKIIRVEKIIYQKNPQKENEGNGGGIDSGGGNGLSYRLEKALSFAKEALTLVKAQSLDTTGSENEVFTFYQKHYEELLNEVAKVTFELKHPENIFIMNKSNNTNIKIHESMVTELRPYAPIQVANNLNVTDLGELASNIIHELGHHLGYTEDDDDLLVKVGSAVIEQAKKMSLDFNDRISLCMKPENFIKTILGKWTGFSRGSWSEKSTPIEITFDETGHYSAKSTCRGKSCYPAFYYGSDEDSDFKTFRIEQACGGMGEGSLDLFFSKKNTTSGRITSMIQSREGSIQYLSFKYFHLNTNLIIFNLQRPI